jgi:hypothetical protein
VSSTVSSKKRKEERQSKSDYYITPHWAVEQFLRAWDEDTGEVNRIRNIYLAHYRMKQYCGIVLDPCAGGDAKHRRMSYPWVLNQAFGIQPITMDIRPDSKAEIIANYLTADVIEKFDLIITNPPFIIIEDIIKKSLSDCKDDGNVVMLARLNYFGAQKRAPWFKDNMPEWAYVHSKRMGFNPEKPNDTDSVEYAHFVWRKGYHPTHTKLRVILPPDND